MLGVEGVILGWSLFVFVFLFCFLPVSKFPGSRKYTQIDVTVCTKIFFFLAIHALFMDGNKRSGPYNKQHCH